MLNILHVINREEIGWTRWLTELMREQSSRGHVSRVALPQGPAAEALRAEGVETIATTALGGVADPLSAWRLSSIIRKNGVDIVHAHLAVSAKIASAASEKAGRPCVASVYRDGDPRPFKRCGKLFPASQAASKGLFSRGVSAESMRRVHCGIDLSPYENFRDGGPDRRREWGWESGERIVGYAATSEDRADDGAFLLAAASVKKMDDAAKFVMWGGAERLAELKTFAAEVGLGESARFISSGVDFESTVQGVDLFVASGEPEGPALKAVLALLNRRPVVAMNSPEAEEIARGGEAVEWDGSGVSPQALAEAILAALNNLEETEARLEKAFDFVAREFDVRRTAMIFEMECQEVIAGTRSPRTA